NGYAHARIRVPLRGLAKRTRNALWPRELLERSLQVRSGAGLILFEEVRGAVDSGPLQKLAQDFVPPGPEQTVRHPDIFRADLAFVFVEAVRTRSENREIDVDYNLRVDARRACIVPRNHD